MTIAYRDFSSQWGVRDSQARRQEGAPAASRPANCRPWLGGRFPNTQRAEAGPFTVTKAYKTAARKLAAKQVALAGARLAKILNEELR
jgi:hypothetical protein